jgi:hypothetical protein
LLTYSENFPPNELFREISKFSKKSGRRRKDGVRRKKDSKKKSTRDHGKN